MCFYCLSKFYHSFLVKCYLFFHTETYDFHHEMLSEVIHGLSTHTSSPRFILGIPSYNLYLGCIFFLTWKPGELYQDVKDNGACLGDLHDPFGGQDHKPELELNVLSILFDVYTKQGASQVALVIKNLSANAGDIGDAILIPGLRRLPGDGHGNPLQHSCLEYPMDRGAWRATVHWITKSQTWPKWLNTHTHTHTCTHTQKWFLNTENWGTKSLWNTGRFHKGYDTVL